MQIIEERLDQLEKRNKRLTAALTLMAVAICAVVTVAATNISRDVSNENRRYEFIRDNEAMGSEGHVLLDSATGDVWRIKKKKKSKVFLTK